MKRIAAGILMVSAVFVLFACSKGENAAEGSLMVHAEISVPETISLNKEETLSVTVSQGDQAVEDASEVQFEIWKADSKEESEMIRAEHTGDGIYEVQKSFSEEGSYFVQTHVTARDLHVMPKKEFVVGKGELTNKEEESNEEHSHH
ncbi:FixH family protein [Metabacillus sp. SLBN-84]